MIRRPPRSSVYSSLFFFFFNDTATTEIYTLSLHDALPISDRGHGADRGRAGLCLGGRHQDRKSTRLNSSHGSISYAVFCLKKNKRQDYRACSSRLCCSRRSLATLSPAPRT